jgi:hypothetical protein
MPRWCVMSGVSGCAWGLLAFVLMDSRTNAAILGAMASAPAIGLFMGRLSKGFRSATIGRRASIAIVSLYLAVAMFAVVGGVVDAMDGVQTAREQAAGVGVAKPLEWAVALVLGLTATGYVLVLVPLAYLNHLLVDAVGWE